MSIRIVLAVVFLSGFLYGRIDVPKLLSDYQNLDQKVRELGERKRFLMLVNRQHALPEDFIPNLTPTAQRPEIRLDIAACAALERMMEAAEEDGHTIIIASGYRDRSYQEDLLQEDIASAMGRGMSCEEAYRYVVWETMPPGCSEHETGLAADLVSPSNQVLDERQADTPENRWLLEHCAEYGFILRYPEDKEEITGVSYEPWHFRYVGTWAAAEIMEEGLTLEEYVYDIIRSDAP